MSKLGMKDTTPHTKAFSFLEKYFIENKSEYVEKLSKINLASEFTSTVISLINSATSDYSIYGRELTIGQSKIMRELTSMVEAALQSIQFISISPPSSEELAGVIRNNLQERIKKEGIIKDIVHSILSALRLYETPCSEDLPKSLVRIEVNTEKVLSSTLDLITRLDAIVEKRVPSKPPEEEKKPKEINEDILRVLQETLGALHLSEVPTALAKKSDRIINTLKSYRVTVEWPLDKDFSNIDTLEKRYDVVFDSELEQIIVTKPCFLKSGDILFKGEVVMLDESS